MIKAKTLNEVGLTAEYQAIHDFYMDKKAKRSGVELMNHIKEGVELIEQMGGTFHAQLAFCIHPIVQNSEDVDVTWSAAYNLACEYAMKANAYLCRPQTDHIDSPQALFEHIGDMSEECRQMLLADKIQNQKDFNIYHAKTHERRVQLARYFHIWISYLNGHHHVSN